jgi:hypothetical protein
MASDADPQNETAPVADRGWLEQVGRDLSAPVRGLGRPILIGGSAVSAAAYPFRNSVTDIGEDKPLGSSAKIGYQLGLWKINVAYTVGYLAYGLIAGDSEAVRKSVFMARATLATALTTTAIKSLNLEERPRHNGDMQSFPSGHASNAFAFAGAVYRNHGWMLGVPALAMASFVGFSRLNDNAHYLHDVLFGATLGLSYAFGLDTQWESADRSKALALVPLVAGSAYGVGAVLDF